MKPEKKKTEKGFHEVVLPVERFMNSLPEIETVNQLRLDPKQEEQVKWWLDRISDKIEPITKTYRVKMNKLIKEFGIENQNQKGKSIGMHVPIWSKHFDKYVETQEMYASQEEEIRIPNIFPLELKIIGNTIPGGIFKHTDWLFSGATLTKPEEDED